MRSILTLLFLVLVHPLHAANLASGGPPSNSGELNHVLPLPLPPGVGGVEPSLSLTYSSRGGLGDLGFGWSLPISSITLDRSVPDPLGDPRWLLDGVELLDDGHNGWVTRIDDGRSVRPVPSGGFEIFDRDGWRYEYGVGDGLVESCLAGPCWPTEARLTRVQDPHGLQVVYRYDDFGDAGRQYLREVFWTMNAAGDPVGPVRSVALDYRALPQTWTTDRLGERQTSLVIDQIRVHVGEERVRSVLPRYEETADGGLVLTAIEERGAGSSAPKRLWGEFEYAPDGLNWTGWDATPFVGTPCDDVVQESGDGTVRMDRFDFTGDGVTDLVGARNGVLSLCSGDVMAVGLPQDPAVHDQPQNWSSHGLTELEALREYAYLGVDSEFLDFDGDGHVDRVRRACAKGKAPCQGILLLERRTGPHSFALEEDITPPGWSSVPTSAQNYLPQGLGEDRGLTDLTGDGLPDWVETQRMAGHWLVWRNDGAGFGPPEAWPAPGEDLSFTPPVTEQAYLDMFWGVPSPLPTSHDTHRGMADVTGDGIADYIEAADGCQTRPDRFCSWWVQPGTGYGYADAFEWPIPFERPPGMGDLFPLSRMFPPICFSQQSGPDWTPDASPCSQPQEGSDRRGIHMNDLDGDGLADLVFGDEVAFNLAGGSWAMPQFAGLPSEGNLGTGPIWSSTQDTIDGRYQDHDGDGFVDFVEGDEWHSASAAGHRIPPHTMTAAVLPSGGRIEYAWEPAIGYATSTTRRDPGVSDPTGPLWVLAGVSHSQGDVGDVEYLYDNPIAKERTLLGFETVTAVAADGSSVERTYDVSGPDLAGQVARTERRAPDGSTLSIHENQAEVLPGDVADQIRVRPTRRTVRVIGTSGDELVQSGRSVWDAEGRLSRREAYAHDGSRLSYTEFTWATAPHPLDPSRDVDRLVARESFDADGARTSFSQLAWSPAGDLEQQADWLDTDGGMHVEELERDPFGYVTEATDREGVVTTVSWAPDYSAVETALSVSPNGAAQWPSHAWPQAPVLHRQRVEFDAATGSALRSQTFNGSASVRESIVRLDAFGRAIEALGTLPDGSGPAVLATAEYDPQDRWIESTSFNYDSAGNPSGSAVRRSWLDPFGRVTQSRSEATAGGDYLVQWLERDAMGRVVRSSRPLLEPGVQATPWGALIHTEVDVAPDGRTVASWTAGLGPNDPDDRVVQDWDIPSDGEAVVRQWTRHSATVDAQEETWIDGAGRLDHLVDAGGNETSYAYDAAGRLSAVIDALGNASYVGFDSWGRRTWLADPDLSQCTGASYDPRDCAWTFEYSPGGNLTSRTDSMGRTLDWGYDALGRVSWATGGCEATPGAPCSDPAQGTSFFLYDGQSPVSGHGAHELGSLTHVMDPTGSVDRVVDSWGRVARESRELMGMRFESAVRQDAWGFVEREGLAVDGQAWEPLVHHRDSMGRLQELRGGWSGVDWVYSVDYDPMDGALTGWRSLGGAVHHERDYGHDGRLRGLIGQVRPAASSGMRRLVDLELDYDAAGRVSSKLDLVAQAGPSLEGFGYDLLGRLTQAGGLTAGYDREYAYDAIGNMTFSSLWLDEGGADYAYPDVGEAGPHGVQSIGAHSGFEYDESGAITSRWRFGSEEWSREYEYGADGRLRSTVHTDADTGLKTRTDGALDAFKRRVIKQVSVDGTPTDTVVRPNERIEVRNGQPVRTIWAGGQRIAETTAAVPAASDAATFFFTDHQNQQVAAAVFEDLAGSPRLIGASQVRRDPFGVELEGDDSLMSRGVSGGEQEATGETYLGWRLYDAEVGRFLQADRLSSASAGMGQGLNRYRYGWNSPTNFTDPSGYSEVVNAVAPMGRMAGMVGMEQRMGLMEGVSEISADGGGVKWGCVAGACFVMGSRANGKGRIRIPKTWTRDNWMSLCTGAGESEKQCADWWNEERARTGGGANVWGSAVNNTNSNMRDHLSHQPGREAADGAAVPVPVGVGGLA